MDRIFKRAGRRTADSKVQQSAKTFADIVPCLSPGMAGILVEQEQFSEVTQDPPSTSDDEKNSLETELNSREEIGSEDELALIPLADDSESLIITVRSVLVGLIIAVVGASVTQLFLFKPIHLRLQPACLQIGAMLLGRGAAWIPGPTWWNPGAFGLKETVFSAVIATSASVGAFGIELLAAQEMFFDRVTSFGMSFGILLSSQLIGYGWAGLLQPILVYPSQVVYPEVLPSVSLFYSLCGGGPVAKDQIAFFKRAFVGMAIYEVFPTYIMPAFQAISLFCLTLPKQQFITSIFGGAQPFEGLGFLNISGDWALVGAHGPFYTPLNAQVHHIIGVLLSLFILSFVYTNSWYDAGVQQNFPFMSVSLLSSDGSKYPINQVVGQDGAPNELAIQKTGLPFFTSTYVVVQIFASLATTSAITHVLIENHHLIFRIFKRSGSNSEVDPHRRVCQKYKDFPLWAFGIILVLSISSALGLSAFGRSGLPPQGLLFAILLSSFLTLAVGFLTAITGFHLHVSGVVQMLGGLLFPGNTFGNMWFTTFGSSTVIQSMNMLKDLKLGQYMHMPPITIVLAQLIGTLMGIFINYGVMKAIMHNQRDVLLTAHGNGVFSGFVIAAFQANSVSWGAFSHKLFLAQQKYSAIPLALILGFFLPIPLVFLHKLWPRAKFNKMNVALLCGSISSGYSGATAGRFLNIIIGLLSQFWARRYRPRWFLKYNYVLSAAFDGGAQLMILFLSMFLQGGDGNMVKFPTYFLNPPSSVPKDYCYMPPESGGE